MGRLSGKHALVTGAAQGIGAAIATLFSREGARVIAADIKDAQGEALVSSLGADACYAHLDVTDADAWQQLITSLKDDPIDVLVNNAGAVVSFEPLHDIDVDLWRSIVELNLTSVFMGMRWTIPQMIRHGGGSIINLSSVSGVVGHDMAAPYQAAKGGIRVLTKNVAITYARQGIRANSVHPGIIQTPMVADQPAAATAAFLNGTPMGRSGQPIDVAYGALYLASDEAQFVTGAEFYIDGGFVAQ